MRQRDKRTEDINELFVTVRKMMKNNWEKEAGKGPNLKIVLSVVHQL
jgi:hypothetical protein